ncbi:MAG: NAD(P)-binding domain-containing protein, partial [Eubacterium sp.]
MKEKIGFIGCGNMAQAMIGGLVNGAVFIPENIVAYDPFEGQRQKIKDQFGITVAESNRTVAQEADYLVLAVKPYIYSEVMKEIAGQIKKEVIVIVIAVGV